MTYPECLDAVAQQYGYNNYASMCHHYNDICSESVPIKLLSAAATMFAEQDKESFAVSFSEWKDLVRVNTPTVSNRWKECYDEYVKKVYVIKDNTELIEIFKREKGVK